MPATIAVSAPGPSASVDLVPVRSEIRASRNIRVAGLHGLTDRGSSGQVGVQADGAFVGTADLEVTLDGTNWIPSAYGALSPGQYAMIPETTAVGARANCTVYTSGTLTLIFGAYG